MSVKRYEWVACDEHACHCDVVESAEGDMVDYEDYAALEAKCAVLAAEVYDLKHPGTYLPSKRETPALDAFLAEVRAQGVTLRKPTGKWASYQTSTGGQGYENLHRRTNDGLRKLQPSYV